MAKVGVFYGSSTGNTARIAGLIAEEFGDADVVLEDVNNLAGDELTDFDLMIFGVSTWGWGELQEDWVAFRDTLGDIDLKDRNVALFGLGDQVAFPDTFVNAMGSLYEVFKEKGCVLRGGWWPVEGYRHRNSTAEVDGAFVGLVIDEDRQPEMTPERVRQWVTRLRGEIGALRNGGV